VKKMSDKKFYVQDVGVIGNLDSELPKRDHLKGDSKTIADIIGVRATMILADIFCQGISFKDSAILVQILRNDRLRRDYLNFHISQQDLADKYELPLFCVESLVGKVGREAEKFAGVCEVCDRWQVCEKGTKCRG
jgi:hypothetical protein